ncbi:MAG: helix-turn-helix transcriptional regulator [Oscillospiraceae bacterium]|nr:helix-turn-helix transcriptional regulator [Oscillospiraceae bacterium]
MSKNIKPLNFDKDIYNTIRKNIRHYRKEKGITSAELAELTELSHDFIRQLQSNSKRTYNFSVETFYKISLALNVSMDKLIEKTEDD